MFGSMSCVFVGWETWGKRLDCRRSNPVLVRVRVQSEGEVRIAVKIASLWGWNLPEGKQEQTTTTARSVINQNTTFLLLVFLGCCLLLYVYSSHSHCYEFCHLIPARDKIFCPHLFTFLFFFLLFTLSRSFSPFLNYFFGYWANLSEQEQTLFQDLHQLAKNNNNNNNNSYASCGAPADLVAPAKNGNGMIPRGRWDKAGCMASS